MIIRPIEQRDWSWIVAQSEQLALAACLSAAPGLEVLDKVRRDTRRMLRAGVDAYAFFIAVDHKTRLGFSAIQQTQAILTGAPRAHLSMLVIAAAYQRLGIGRQLLNHAEQWARRQRLDALTLDVFETNAAAREFYAACGYQTEMRTLVRQLGDSGNRQGNKSSPPMHANQRK